MNRQNTAGHKQILAEISKTRDVFAELDDFFRKADENISHDPDDPRDGIGRLPGLDRLMFLIPCVFNRLEEDISKSREGENVALIIESLQALHVNHPLTIRNYSARILKTIRFTVCSSLLCITFLNA